ERERVDLRGDVEWAVRDAYDSAVVLVRGEDVAGGERRTVDVAPRVEVLGVHVQGARDPERVSRDDDRTLREIHFLFARRPDGERRDAVRSRGRQGPAQLGRDCGAASGASGGVR